MECGVRSPHKRASRASRTVTLRARHAHCAHDSVLKSAVLLPFSIASVLTAFALPHADERFVVVASPATATIAAAMTQTISVREPEARCHTVVHFERIDGASLPLHGSAWLYSSPGAQTSDLPANAHAIATRTLVFVAHPHRTVSNLSREQVAALLDGSLANWRQLGGPDAPVRFLRTSDPDDLDSIRQFTGSAKERAADAGNSFYGDHRCERLVTGDPFAIGTMAAEAAADAISRGAPLRILSIDGIESSASGDEVSCYPLVRTLQLRIAHPDDPRSDSLHRFLHSEHGIDSLTAAGYVSLANQ